MTGMFAIIRAQKIKTVSAVARSARHTFREQPTHNADGSKSIRNRISGSLNTHDLLSSLSARLPATRRKDAVLCIEYLITASPEAFIKHGGHLNDLGSGYFADALTWLRARHGKDNVICSVVHLDETTPHMVAYVVPLTNDGRLSARDFLGGPKAMRDMQNSFYDSCGHPYGLLRGIPGSKAHHTNVAQFYTALQDRAPAAKLTLLDYAAKAVGHETENWRQAQTFVKQQDQQAAVDALQRKALRSRTQALANTEQQARQKTLRSQQIAREQEKKDRSLLQREQELARRQPELDIAIARAEAIERLWEEHERRGSAAQYQYSPQKTLRPR